MHVAINGRTQLSLYVPEPHAATLENVRRLLDPVQFGLIPAHVTLCREEELDGLGFELIASRLGSAKAATLALRFGKPESFSGHGILLPCIAGEAEFHALRQQVLGAAAIRRHVPHITLAHPRNPRSPDNSPSNVGTMPSEFAVTFTRVHLIRQEGSSPWQVLERHPLAGTNAAAPNPSIEATSQRPLRALCAAPHVKR